MRGALRVVRSAMQRPGVDVAQQPPRVGEIQTIFNNRQEDCGNANMQGTWRSLGVERAALVTETVVALGGFRRGALVLDVGSGCGHRLGSFAQRFGTVGVGVDVATRLVAWANANRNVGGMNAFREADASNLDWLPASTVDFVFSIGVLFFTVQVRVGRQTTCCDLAWPTHRPPHPFPRPVAPFPTTPPPRVCP